MHFGSDAVAARETAAAIEAAGGEAFTPQARLGDPGDAEALWEAFDAQAKSLDILVNNAGINGGRVPLAEVTPASFDRLFDTNTKAPVFVTQQGLPRLRDGGRIINVSTGLTRGAVVPELMAYAMTKGAVDVFTTTLAKELGRRAITVNTVAPGVVDTDMNADWLRSNVDARESVAATSPLGRVGIPEDTAGIAAFLASEDGRWVTGQWIDASGGALI